MKSRLVETICLVRWGVAITCVGIPPRAPDVETPMGRARGKRDAIKTRGRRALIKMHLSMRGSHRSETKIQPVGSDGFIHGLLPSLKEE